MTRKNFQNLVLRLSHSRAEVYAGLSGCCVTWRLGFPQPSASQCSLVPRMNMPALIQGNIHSCRFIYYFWLCVYVGIGGLDLSMGTCGGQRHQTPWSWSHKRLEAFWYGSWGRNSRAWPEQLITPAPSLSLATEQYKAGQNPSQRYKNQLFLERAKYFIT